VRSRLLNLPMRPLLLYYSHLLATHRSRGWCVSFLIAAVLQF